MPRRGCGGSWWRGSLRPDRPPSAGAGRQPPGWRSGRGSPTPRSACRTAHRPRRRTGSRSSRRRRVKIRSRFFSVSPMYFDTDAGQVDAEHLETQLGAEHLRGHRLARPRLSGEQHLQPLGAGDASPHSPIRRARDRGGGGRRRSTAGRRAGGRAARGRSIHSPARVAWPVRRPRADDACLAPMSRSGPAGAGSPRDRAAITLTSPAAWICSIESLNLAATSRASSAPVRLAPRAMALGEARERDLDDEGGAIAHGHGIPPRCGEQHDPVRAFVDRAEQAPPLGHREVFQAVDAEHATFERGGQSAHRRARRAGRAHGLRAVPPARGLPRPGPPRHRVRTRRAAGACPPPAAARAGRRPPRVRSHHVRQRGAARSRPRRPPAARPRGETQPAGLPP